MSRTTMQRTLPGADSPRPSRRTCRRPAVLLVPLLAGGLVTLAAPARANTIHVTTTADEYDDSGPGIGCSLREAITAANTDKAFGGCAKGEDDDTIVVPQGEYRLTREGDDDTNENGDLDIADALTIVGEGAKKTIIDAQELDRVLHVLKVPSNRIIELLGVTLRGGSSPGAGGALFDEGTVYAENVEMRDSDAATYGGAVAAAVGANLHIRYSTIAGCHSVFGGGAIYNLGDTTLQDSTLAHNYTTETQTSGGGIENLKKLELDRTTVDDNTAVGDGGGLANVGSDAIAILVEATISGNDAKGNGGGVLNANGYVALYSATVASNRANSNNGGAGEGGGIFRDSGTVIVGNTIIGDNTRGTGAQASADDCKGTLDSLGYNLLETTTGCTFDNVLDGNKLGQDPSLGPLADNGGPGRTHRLKDDSPAIESGNPLGCKDSIGHPLILDARSSLRSQDYDGLGGARCDIGAYEAIPRGLCLATPPKPTGLSPFDLAGYESVTLDWDDVPCTSQYKVMVRLGAVDGPRVAHGRTRDVSAFHIPRPLIPGKVYYWRVKACDAYGCRKSDWVAFLALPPS